MSAADIAKEAQSEERITPRQALDIADEALAGWRRTNADMKELLVGLTLPEKAAEAPQPSRFPAAVADHPAFTQRFNARLIAVGMAATMNEHRRLVG